MPRNYFTQWLLHQTTKRRISDNALAGAIDVTPQAISKCRAKGNHMSDKTCLSIASLVGAQPQVALVMLYSERTPDPSAARLMREIACVLQMFYVNAFNRNESWWDDIGMLMPVPAKLHWATQPRPARRKPGPRPKLPKLAAC